MQREFSMDVIISSNEFGITTINRKEDKQFHVELLFLGIIFENRRKPWLLKI
jgi:hypothetical protein